MLIINYVVYESLSKKNSLANAYHMHICQNVNMKVSLKIPLKKTNGSIQPLVRRFLKREKF